MYRLLVQPHTCAGPVCTAASAQVDAHILDFLVQEWFPYREAEHYAVVEEALELLAEPGWLTVPDNPRLDVTLNHDKVDRYPVVRVD